MGAPTQAATLPPLAAATPPPLNVLCRPPPPPPPLVQVLFCGRDMHAGYAFTKQELEGETGVEVSV